MESKENLIQLQSRELSTTKDKLTISEKELEEEEVKENLNQSQKEKVLDRFYRTNQSGSFGSGLGLSIVKWIADQHFATVTLTDEQPTGLCCTVTFKRVVGQVE